MKSKIYNVKIAVIVPYMCAVNVTLEISIMKVFCVCKEISVLGDVSMCVCVCVHVLSSSSTKLIQQDSTRCHLKGRW